VKIAVIGTRGFPGVQGGVEKHAEELYPRLAAMGFDVTVFARAPYFPPERRVATWHGVAIEYLSAPRSKHFEAFVHSFRAAARCIARRRELDAVHVHNIGPALCIPLLNLFGMRTVLTYHSPNYEHRKWGRIARAILRLGEWVGLRWSDRIITVADVNQARLRRKYGRHVVSILNGIAKAQRVEPGETLRAHGLEPGRYFFTACRFVEGKGLEDLIAAFRAAAVAPGLKLVIAGDADHETRYSRDVKKRAGETPGVVLTGFVTGRSLQELYSNAGLFVLPSYSEGLPLALLEAMSYGSPVLASDIPANRQVPLADNRFYPVGNVAALQARMLELIRLGLPAAEDESCRLALAERYNWDAVARRTAALFRELVPSPVP
jgi:glycosyltransferase involved in cell wall biosynthesis